jgi:hypothetical protein
MTKKMKREFEKIERSLKTVRDAKEHFGVSLEPLAAHYAKKRMDIANTIGRKKDVRRSR